MEEEIPKVEVKKPAVTKAEKIDEVRINQENAIQVIKNESSSQAESLQERLRKRKAGNFLLFCNPPLIALAQKQAES